MWHEVMNDNWGAWNWQKTLKFGKSILIYWSLHSHNTVFSGMFLMCSLEEAHEMYIKQHCIFTEYNVTFSPDVIVAWECMVDK